MTPTFLFQNPAQVLALRIDDLLSRLTLGEKIGQLMHENAAIPRLGVPAYNWWSEACHGVGRNGRATVFPQVIGLASTWNRALVQQVADAIAAEARAKHHAAAAADRRGQYQGLTFWTPNINIFRDPRWGRGQETFGEDPFLTGELGAAMVRGLQGDHPHYLKVAACAKHFAVHSGPEQARHGFDAQPTPKDLHETYLPAFEKLVRGGVEAVMGAYNRTLGEPCCGSRLLLMETLRGSWDFAGHVVSDCGAIDDFHRHHHVTRNAAESAALAVRVGCDLNCGCTYNDLTVAVRDGLINEAEIDTALRRLLATKFKLGLFDPPECVPWSTMPIDLVDGIEHRALARRAAAESFVLLKNTGVLPLSRNPTSLLIVGPTAANVGALLGNYYGVSPQLVTFVEGLVERVGESTAVEYRAGCPIFGQQAPGVNYTLPTAEAAEVVVAVLGLDGTLEGEEGDTVASPSGGDRDAIELPACQREFLIALRPRAKKLVLVLTGGSAIAIPQEHELCDAVLLAWYPGGEGGRALADVLFGEVSPSGKLPVTVPYCTSDLPPFDDYRMQGRTYRFGSTEPLYPFGFGLSYARLAYSELTLSHTSIDENELTVGAAVTNVHGPDADECVQCYLIPPQDWPHVPHATLVAFEKIKIPAGATRRVEFRLNARAFYQFNHRGEHVRVPGTYGIVLGAASPTERAVALGAPAPLHGKVQVI